MEKQEVALCLQGKLDLNSWPNDTNPASGQSGICKPTIHLQSNFY